jgi:polyisoprenoid-binding protein YceI
MKKLLAMLILSLSTSAFSAGFTDLEKVEINANESKLTWLGKKVTGEHTGEIKIAKGHLNFKKDSLIAGEFEIDMGTITNTDITDKEYHTKFIDHINSDDFFGTAKFKTATIKIKSAKKGKDNNYKIKADLTIKGITAPVAFDAVVSKDKATAKVVFDRTKYGIKFKSGKFDPGLGDKLIYDDVTLNVALVGAPVNTPAPAGAVK